VYSVAKRYVLLFLLSIAVSLSVLAGFNVAVDAYDVFATLGGEPVPIRGAGTRMSKAYAIRARQPDCLILGTSRAAIGYRSGHPAWSCDRPYNAGLPKAHLYEVRRYLEHGIAQGTLRQVFLALDFEMFRNHDRVLEDFSESRLAVSVAGQPQSLPVNELLGLALSLESIRKGVQVLRHPDHLPWFDAGGDWQPESLVEIMREQGRGKGTAEASRQLTTILVRLLTRPGAYDLDPDGRLAAFEDLDAILRLCADHDLRLTVVVNPVHAYYHELLRQLDLDLKYDQWKQEVGRRLQHHRQQQAYWNFDLANAYTLQALPVDEDRITQLDGFWDPSHFRRSLGDAVMHLALSGATGPVPAALDMLGQPPDAYSQVGEPWKFQDPIAQTRVRNWLVGLKEKRRVAAR